MTGTIFICQRENFDNLNFILCDKEVQHTTNKNRKTR